MNDLRIDRSTGPRPRGPVILFRDSSRFRSALAGTSRRQIIINTGDTSMRFTRLASIAFAFMAIVALGFANTARADEGLVHIRFLKGGWVIGGTIGEGTLTFRGRRYPLRIGGLSWGLTFGGAAINLRGRVRNIFQARDVEGVYGAGAAGAAVIRGPQAVVLTNQRGAVMELAGMQTGLMVNLDLNGMAVSLR
jgi:hypothetical protein